MADRQPPAQARAWTGPGFREFVIMMAGLQALNALAIDAMIPALPEIGRSLGVATENERQLIVALYVLGFGTTQIIYGPLSDRYGRKPVLVASLSLYLGFALACAAAGSFTLLLVARLLQGASAAATRVLVVSIVRDRFEGAVMARLMSLVFLVFLLIPMLAPTFGQLTLLFAPWRAIFFGLAAFSGLMLVWCALRLPETLHPEFRRPLSLASIRDGTRETLTDRQSLGYTLGFTAMTGALMGYINSIQQIVFDVFHRPDLVAIVFGAVAAPMAVTSYLNSRLVGSVGIRRLAHVGLIGFTGFSALHLLVAELGETIWVFIGLQGLIMGCFGLAAANLGSLAIQPLGHVAGTASSVQGTIGTIIGALIGLAIGQSFDGTQIPMALGFAGCGLIALICTYVTERGRFFTRDAAPAPSS
jgi:DHA1 family bicyclomycin/chloramphenicol resistance-like MFS transporter